jgi:hypothetical protein
LSKREEPLPEVQYSIWAHFLGLPEALRTTKGLTMLESCLGKILTVETKESFKGKAAGPRVRVLVEDIANLPLTCRLLGSKAGTFLEHKIVYIGRPEQCTRCKCYGHRVRDCTRPSKPEEGQPTRDTHDVPRGRDHSPQRRRRSPGPPRRRERGSRSPRRNSQSPPRRWEPAPEGLDRRHGARNGDTRDADHYRRRARQDERPRRERNGEEDRRREQRPRYREAHHDHLQPRRQIEEQQVGCEAAGNEHTVETPDEPEPPQLQSIVREKAASSTNNAAIEAQDLHEEHDMPAPDTTR